MNENEILILLEQIYSGRITREQLPVELYKYYAKDFHTIIEKAFGELKEPYVLNSNSFAAAKTFHYVNDVQNQIVNDVKKYFENSKQISDIYESWYRTEKRTATRSAQTASKWDKILERANILPLLQYQTVGDARVREEHAALDGITRPVNDPFWDAYYPPNGYNCRCQLIQLDEGEVTKDEDIDFNLIEEEVDEIFRFNPGKEQKLFSDKHPYFEVPRKYTDLKNNNFNLPIDYGL